MAPATAVDTEGAAKHQHVDSSAVGHVGVIPLVDACSDYYHALAVCLLCCGGKGSCCLDDFFGFHAGDLFLPLRCVRQVIVVARSTVGVVESAVYAIMCH